MTALPLHRWLDEAQEDREVAWRGDERLTLAQLRRQVIALCVRLQADSGVRWALCFDDSFWFTVALLAVLHAGKTPVILGHSRPSLLAEQATQFDGVLTDTALESATHASLRLPVAEQKETYTLPPLPQNAEVVLFTSGSTGLPREVRKPVACLDREAGWLAQRWGESLRGCSVVASVSHQHLYGFAFRIILPMALGLPFDCRQSLYSEQLSAQSRLRRYLFISSPAFLRRLDLSLPAPRFARVFSAGSALHWTTAEAVWRWFNQPVSEIYGSTETGVLAWRMCDEEYTAWVPFAEVSFQQDVSSRWVAHSPIIPQKAGWQLDDKLVFLPGGGFQLAGRHDRIVKVEDKRVSLSEIERRLVALPEISDAAALALVRHGRTAIGVVLVLQDGVGAETLPRLKRQWRSELQRWLEPVALPRYWRVVASIPQNSQSKRAWPQIEELFHAAG
ncbi:acyl-CoA synthetase [Paramixta manurensis]|uniref:Acyl-CoA synthetase n=1 Tax=Paramixta manurensis TaxID=2740817 RepID=A0A6M8UN36_9GAMM|nr:acyl-CoA synthetase [Erwiniaceae bacterium PD-1]